MSFKFEILEAFDPAYETKVIDLFDNNSDNAITIWGNDDKDKQLALMISKAPEMLEMLNYMLENGFCIDKYGEDLTHNVKKIIEQATNINNLKF